MLQPLVYVVILNNNRRDDTLACLDSVYRSDYQNFRVIMLDNGSTDGSVDVVRASYSDVQIVLLTANSGYAGNNNVGIKLALEQGAEWVLVLNDDTVLDPACLSTMIRIATEDPTIGVAGPMVYHFDEPDVIQSAGGILGKYWQSDHLGKNELDQGQYSSPHVVEWISGCAILVRRIAIEQAGMLDEDYFLYWEETEWCVRISRKGWKIIQVPKAHLWHKGVKRNYEPKPFFMYYGTRNHLLTLKKHKAPLRARVFTWFQIIRTIVSWSIKPKWHHKHEYRNAMWKGALDYLRHRSGPMPL